MAALQSSSLDTPRSAEPAHDVDIDAGAVSVDVARSAPRVAQPQRRFGEAEAPAVREEGATEERLEDLGQIISAYNQVTANLQRSHEALHAEVARLQKELASADAQLQRSRRLAALGEMAAGIAHEIRNPLGAIQLYADLLAGDLAEMSKATTAVSDIDTSSTNVVSVDGEVIARSLDTARKIASAVFGLNGIVNDVLSFARELKPRHQSVRLVEAFARVVDGHAARLSRSKIQLDVQCDSELYGRLDPELFHQALMNLAHNAIDAIGDQPGRLTFTAETNSEGRLILSVRDTGAGIDTTAIDRIFNPFFTTRNTGTGLGLAIVHRIVDVHCGTIAVHNHGGAVFEMNLPGFATDIESEDESEDRATSPDDEGRPHIAGRIARESDQT